MTIKHGTPPKANFIRVANDSFGRTGMSIEAEYIHLYLLSKPATWVVRIHDIARVFRVSERTARRRMEEIVKAGFARLRAIGEQGRRGIRVWDYEVSHEPIFLSVASSKVVSFDLVTDGRHSKTEGYQQDLPSVKTEDTVRSKEEEGREIAEYLAAVKGALGGKELA